MKKIKDSHHHTVREGRRNHHRVIEGDKKQYIKAKESDEYFHCEGNRNEGKKQLNLSVDRNSRIARHKGLVNLEEQEK